jgi:acetoacetate decarboxylase
MGLPQEICPAVDRDPLVGTLDYGGVRITTGTMGFKHEALDLDKVRAGLEKPNYLLKIIPHADGTPRILEQVDYRLEDIVVKGGPSLPRSTCTPTLCRRLPSFPCARSSPPRISSQT